MINDSSLNSVFFFGKGTPIMVADELTRNIIQFLIRGESKIPEVARDCLYKAQITVRLDRLSPKPLRLPQNFKRMLTCQDLDECLLKLRKIIRINENAWLSIQNSVKRAVFISSNHWFPHSSPPQRFSFSVKLLRRGYRLLILLQENPCSFTERK